MRFVIEIPDELLRGATGEPAADAAGALTAAVPLSGGPAANGARPASGDVPEAFSAGPAEGGMVRGTLDGDVASALDGGAAPE